MERKEGDEFRGPVMSLYVATKSLTRPEVGTKDNFHPCYRRTRALFPVIINELIPKINDMLVSEFTSNKDEGVALNENSTSGVYQQYVVVMMQKGANEAWRCYEVSVRLQGRLSYLDVIISEYNEHTCT